MSCESCGDLKARERDHEDMESMTLCWTCFDECVTILGELDECPPGVMPATFLPKDIMKRLLYGLAKDEDGNNINERVYT